MNNYEKFCMLHHNNAPLILGNVWDVNVAKKMEAQGIKAIGTSSAAIAHILGYKDGEEISFEELTYLVKRIITNISLPMSVDMEGGYSKKLSDITAHITELCDLGVVGINIEDSTTNAGRALRTTDDFAATISSIKNHLQQKNLSMFVNIRTDAFLLGVPDPLQETLKRISIFEQAGADGIFIPFLSKEHDIKAVTSATNLPINVMCAPEIPSFQRLSNLGVKRISMGNFIYRSMMSNFEMKVQNVLNERSFDSLFEAQ